MKVAIISSSEQATNHLSSLTPLEKAVLDKLLDKAGEPFETIRRQLSVVTLAKRNFTEVGFYIEFVLLTEAQVKRDAPDMTLGGIGAEFPGLEHGAGFVLFIRQGVMSMLEGFTFDEKWPESTSEFKLFKIDST
jgi:hypothetical protein